MFYIDLHEIYQSIYLLASKCNLSGDYIDSLPPYDRDLYLTYYKEELKMLKDQQRKADSGVNISRGPMIGSMPDIGI